MDVEDINTCYPGKIISFDGETQTCTCQIQVEDYYSGIEYSYLKQEAPVLVDVPVYVPQAGGWMLTFPVKEGDDCLVLYAQKGYDHWLYSGASETGLVDGLPPAEHYREFSLRDAICIVGLRPIPRAIPNYNTEDAELRNEGLTHRITMKANGDIELHTDTDIHVTAQNVNVKATTANVEAPAVNVKTDKLDVTSPLSSFSGNVTVGGNLTVAGGISMGGARKGSTCTLNGSLVMNGDSTFNGGATFSKDVTAEGKSVSKHTHIDAEGRPTQPPS